MACWHIEQLNNRQINGGRHHLDNMQYKDSPYSHQKKKT